MLKSTPPVDVLELRFENVSRVTLREYFFENTWTDPNANDIQAILPNNIFDISSKVEREAFLKQIEAQEANLENDLENKYPSDSKAKSHKPKLRSMKSTFMLPGYLQTDEATTILDHFSNLEEYSSFLKQSHTTEGNPAIYFCDSKKEYCFNVKIGDENFIYSSSDEKSLISALNELTSVITLSKIQQKYSHHIAQLLKEKKASVYPGAVQETITIVSQALKKLIETACNISDTSDRANSGISNAQKLGIKTNGVDTIQQQTGSTIGFLDLVTTIASTLPEQINEIRLGYRLINDSAELYQSADDFYNDSELNKSTKIKSYKMGQEGIDKIMSGTTGLASTLTELTSTGVHIASVLQKIPLSNLAVSYLTTLAPGMLGMIHLGLIGKQYSDSNDYKTQMKLISAKFKFFALHYPSEHLSKIPLGLLETSPEFRTIQEQKMLGMQLCTYLNRNLKMQYDQSIRGVVSNSLQLGVSAGTLLQSGLVKGALIAAGISATSIGTIGISLGAIALAGCAAAYYNYRKTKKQSEKRETENQLLYEYGGMASTENGLLLRLYFAISAEHIQQSQMELHVSQKDTNKYKTYTKEFDTKKQTEPKIGSPQNVIINTTDKFGALVKQLTGLSPKEFILSMEKLLNSLGVEPEVDYLCKNVNTQGLQYGLNQAIKNRNERTMGAPGAQLTFKSIQSVNNENGAKSNNNNVESMGPVISIASSDPILAHKEVLEAIRAAEKNQTELKHAIPKPLITYWEQEVNYDIMLNETNLKKIMMMIDDILNDEMREKLDVVYAALVAADDKYRDEFNKLLHTYQTQNTTPPSEKKLKEDLKKDIENHKKLKNDFEKLYEAAQRDIQETKNSIEKSQLYSNKNVI